jgi:hypothetical protein
LYTGASTLIGAVVQDQFAVLDRDAAARVMVHADGAFVIAKAVTHPVAIRLLY